MKMVFIQIGRRQDAVAEEDYRGLRVIRVPSSAKVLSTLEGWKLEVPGQATFWLPPDVQVVEPWAPRLRERKRRAI